MRINRVYDMVFEEISKGNIFVARDKAKDLLELCLKYPVILFLSYMEDYIMDDDNEIDEIRKKYTKALDIVNTLIDRKISLGDWQELCHDIGMLKAEDIPVKEKNFNICLNILEITKNVSSIYLNLKYFGGKNFASIRNKIWGHSAATTDETEAYDVLEKLVRTFNDILVVSNYKFLEVFDGNSICKLILADDREQLNCCYINEYSILESVSLKDKTITFLNYENGCKVNDRVLVNRVIELKRKMDFLCPDDKDIDKNEIYDEDFEKLKESVSKDIIANTVFYDILRQELVKPKSIVWIKAERGMGKTTFARCICDNDIDSLDCNDKGYRKQKGLLTKEMSPDTEFSIWCFNCKDTLQTSKMVFRNQLNQFLFKGFRNHSQLTKAADIFWEELKKDNVDDVSLKQCFGEYLNVAYQSKHNRNLKLVIVIDGVEEVNYAAEGELNISELLSILSLPDNVYIVLLSRTDDEVKLANYALNDLVTAKYELYRDNSTYQKDLKRYIKKFFNNQYTQDEIKRLLSKADYRFWNLVSLKILFENNKIENNLLLDDTNISKVVDIYLGMIPSKMYREKALKLLVTLAILKRPVRCEELSSLLTRRYGCVSSQTIDLLRRLSGYIKVDKKLSKNKMLPINLVSLAYDELYEEFQKEQYKSIRENIINEIEGEVSRIIGGYNIEKVESPHLITIDANRALAMCHMLDVLANKSENTTLDNLMDCFFAFLIILNNSTDVIKYGNYWSNLITYTSENIKQRIMKVEDDDELLKEVFLFIDLSVLACTKDETKVIHGIEKGMLRNIADIIDDKVIKEFYQRFDGVISNSSEGNCDIKINQIYNFACEHYDQISRFNENNQSGILLILCTFFLRIASNVQKGEDVSEDINRYRKILCENIYEFKRTNNAVELLRQATIFAGLLVSIKNIDDARRLFDVSKYLFGKYYELEERPEILKSNLGMEGKYFFNIANYLFKIGKYNEAIDFIEKSICTFKQACKFNRFWMLNKDETDILDSYILHIDILKSMGCNNDMLISECERIIDTAEALSEMCLSDQRALLAEYIVRIQRYLISLYEGNGDNENVEYGRKALESYCLKYGVETAMYKPYKWVEWSSLCL